MAAPAKRIDGIDFWRGLALLTIFIDHVPENVFQHVTQKNFGFSDAAELFVFLSGVSVALAYGTRFFDGETVGAVRALLRRAFTLYWVQILISYAVFCLKKKKKINHNRTNTKTRDDKPRDIDTEHAAAQHDATNRTRVDDT